ncbi:MAG: signal peptidase II [Pseudomonadota bacterium]|nr:signal peptidase II [Pseudomonadota bacterium]
MINLREIKEKIIKKENFYFLIIVLFIFSLDRYTKIEIINNFSENSFYINDFINFDLVWNTGIGFGLFQSSSILLYNSISLLIAFVILFLIYLLIISDKLDKISLSLILGGAIGNFYDRMIFKAVPDFIDLHYKNFHWFTFNVADILISLGIIIFLIKGLLESKIK